MIQLCETSKVADRTIHGNTVMWKNCMRGKYVDLYDVGCENHHRKPDHSKYCVKIHKRYGWAHCLRLSISSVFVLATIILNQPHIDAYYEQNPIGRLKT